LQDVETASAALANLGSVTPIDVPGAAGTLPSDIKAAGFVGDRHGSAGRTHGFLHSPDGEFRTIDSPGASLTVTAAINDRRDTMAQIAARVPVDPCAGAIPGSAEALQCPDSDGDGFTDLEEENGYIDLNLNGVLDAGDFEFPRERQFLFSDVTHSGSGAGVVFPTVINPSQPIGHTQVLVTISSGGALGVATFTYQFDGSRPSAPKTIRPIVDLDRNLRLMFYVSRWVAGDTYSFDVSTGPSRKVADPLVPNIYVQYDYMGWDTPGAPCTSDDDAGLEQLNLVCHEGFLNHTDAPGDPLFRKVVDQFAAHGIRLFIDPVHAIVPHAVVLTFARASDPGLGPLAACAGWDLVAGDISNGQAVSFFDIKNRPGSDFAVEAFRRFVYHYAVFGHFNSCLTNDQTATVGNCNSCPQSRGPGGAQPVAPSTGFSELPGNDLIVSMGSTYFDPSSSMSRNPFSDEGVFMHELGHNLGLTHDGDKYGQEEIPFAPNYLSVMNYRYSLTGIQNAEAPGSVVSVERLRTVDYSEHALGTLDESNLDESAALSPLTSSYTGIIRFYDANGGIHFGAESGPIDWNGDGIIESGPVSADVNGDGQFSTNIEGYADWIHGPCTSSADTPVNEVRLYWHYQFDLSIDPHEPCVMGRAQSLWYNFQISRWGQAD